MKRIALFLTIALAPIFLSACMSGSTVDLNNITCDGIKLGDNVGDVFFDDYTLSDRFPEQENTINFEEWKITTDDEGTITKIHANVSDIRISINSNTKCITVEDIIDILGKDYLSKWYDKEQQLRMISYAGDEWNKTREETIKKDEVYSNLTFEDKIEIHRYLQSQYDKYDEQVGGDSGDKYSDQIFEETANKYGISQDNLMKIWIDTDVSSAANRSNNTITEVLSYDATLSFNGEMSLIANSKEVLDRFLNAIADENQGTIDELLQSGQVAQVPVGTHVNIIEKKIGVAKVKILDGIYADNEVWVLIESVHEQ